MKVRLISSAVGIAVLIAVLLLHNTFVLPLILGAIIAIILFELSRAVGGEKFHLALIGVLTYGFVKPFLDFYRLQLEKGMALQVISVISSLLLPLCLLCVFLEFLWHHGQYKVEQLAFMSGAMYFVTWSLCQLILVMFMGESLGGHGILYLILALGGAWIADSGAYFCGVAFGKHKLCPDISPKKTVEGFIGGLISNAIIIMLIFLIYAAVRHIPFGFVQGCKAALLGLVCAGISVMGDLTASVIKREKGIKDYGNIMPGHGGLMDRFDSVLFVVPAFSLVITLFPIF